MPQRTTCRSLQRKQSLETQYAWITTLEELLQALQKSMGMWVGEILILYEAVGKETAGFVNIEGKLFSL